MMEFTYETDVNQMDPGSMTEEELEKARRSAKIKRRIGFAIALVGMLYISVPMLVGAFGGVSRGEIWDPFTGEPLAKGAVPTDECLTRAEELIAKSGRLERVDPVWDDQVTAWTVHCRKDHSDAFQMLHDARRKLRKRSKAAK